MRFSDVLAPEHVPVQTLMPACHSSDGVLWTRLGRTPKVMNVQQVNSGDEVR